MRAIDKLIRYDLGMTNALAAKLCGVTEPVLSQIRSGRQTPSDGSVVLARIARAFGVEDPASAR